MPPAMTADTLAVPRLAAPAPAETERPVTDWIFGCESYAVYNPTLDASIVLGVNTDKRIGTEPTINVLLRDISDMLFPGHRVEVPVVG